MMILRTQMSQICRKPAVLFCALLLLAGTIASADAGAVYSVTVTNLTRGQQFTPILVATHQKGINLFTLGSAASTQLATLAEEGNTAPLADLLQQTGKVYDLQMGSSLLNPGASVSFMIGAQGTYNRISMAAMLIPTNDGFFSLNAVELPRGKSKSITLYSPAYDSGSERNDELCSSIPGPFFDECGGPGGGGSPSGDEEGFVHVHSGIHGVGDMDPAIRDWQNPVARIAIHRVK